MWSDDYDDLYDAMPYFEVEYRCPSCGAMTRGRNDSGGSWCGCGSAMSESYSSADAERWNRAVDRRARGW